MRHRIGNGELIEGDCLFALQRMDDGVVTLAVTSPPYLNAVNYEGHADKLARRTQRWERSEVEYDEYRQFLMERFKALLRVVRPGGHNVVNIAPVSWRGERIPLSFHFVSWMEQIGWKFREDIIWEKTVARDRRSGVLLQHPYPGYYYPSFVAEYVFVFQRPSGHRRTDNIYWHRNADEKEANRLDLTDYQGEKSKNVWRIRPLSPQENDHPCPYPDALVERVIELYSYKGDVVMDIFSGSGQTSLAAERMGRRHIGIEIMPEYVRYTKQRFHRMDAQQRVSFDA